MARGTLLQSRTLKSSGSPLLPVSVVTVSSPTTNEGLLWNGSAWVSAGTQSPGDNSVKPASTAYADAAVAVEAARAAAAEALRAPIASPTFTGTTTAPEFSASGTTGATAPTRWMGGTASGAPVSGTFLVGDFVIDQTGIIWVCTTLGTPGTWTAIQPNVELGYAARTSTFTTTSTGLVDVTSLTVTVTVGARPIKIEAYTPVQNSAAAQYSVLELDEDGTQIQQVNAGLGSAGELWPITVQARRAPAAGSHTYKIRLASSAAGNTASIAAASPAPSFIQVLQV